MIANFIKVENMKMIKCFEVMENMNFNIHCSCDCDTQVSFLYAYDDFDDESKEVHQLIKDISTHFKVCHCPPHRFCELCKNDCVEARYCDRYSVGEESIAKRAHYKTEDCEYRTEHFCHHQRKNEVNLLKRKRIE